MLVKCPICGSHVPKDAALELTVQGEPRAFCSARCAEEAGAGEAVLDVPRPPTRILVAVDGSGPSLRAVEMAAALAKATGGEVKLLHVVSEAWFQALGVGSMPARLLGIERKELERMLREESDAQLEHAGRICAHAGVPFSSRVELGKPVEVLAAVAAEADLVVMGSRGLGAIVGTVIGSLSHRTLAATRTPTLVVH